MTRRSGSSPSDICAARKPALLGAGLLAILHRAAERIGEQLLHVAGVVGGRLLRRRRVRQQRAGVRDEAGIQHLLELAVAIVFFKVAAHVAFCLALSPSS
jgi:hypothetical protein